MNYIISLGGSIINPGKVDIKFLKSFRRLILGQIKKGDRFIITTGGGSICREYQHAAFALGVKKVEELDLIGIEACDLNAKLIHSVFLPHAYKEFFNHPKYAKKIRSNLIIASGGLPPPPGSSDSTSLKYAQAVNAKVLVNLTNVTGIYNRDPYKYKNAKLVPRLSWKKFREQFGSGRQPGQHVPFDQSVARPAERYGLMVAILDGRNLKNFQNFLAGENFRGTVIQ